MGLLGKDQARTAGLEDHLGARVEHPIAQAPFKHADNAPRAVVLVEIEHYRAKLGASTDFAEFAARVTSVYEKISNHQRLVHRRADPITTPVQLNRC